MMISDEVEGSPQLDVIVTGASGLLGRAVVAEFKKKNWKVLGLAYTRARGDLMKLDLMNTDAVYNLVQEIKPHVIIHCAAERSPEKVQEGIAHVRMLNIEASKNLAEFASQVNAIFVFISTDYVFNGENPPYSEDSIPHPVNEYGWTKCEAEREVLRAYPGSIILRIPVLYGGEKHIGESAVSWLVNDVLIGAPTNVSSQEIRFPAYTPDVAAIIYKLVDKKLNVNPELSSFFHWCGQEAFTKHDMARVIAEEFSRSHDHLTPDPNPVNTVMRPMNVQLDCSRLEELGIEQYTPFREGVRESYRKFFEYRV